MAIWIKIILIPLVGAFIGYITNSIAIYMMFRPQEAKYIGKWRVPFTPGVIPKERDRLASSVAQVVSETLLSADVLAGALLSESLIEKLEHGIDGFFHKYRNSDMTLQEAVGAFLGSDKTAQLSATLTGEISQTVSRELADFSKGGEIAQVSLFGLKDNLSGKSASKALLAKLMSEGLITNLSGLIGGQINRLVSQNAPKVLPGLLEQQAEQMLQRPVSELLAHYEDDLPRIRASIMGMYRAFITTELPKALETLNLGEVVEKRIHSFNLGETEQIIRSVINKELRYVIWMGALLGFVIGFINLLFI